MNLNTKYHCHKCGGHGYYEIECAEGDHTTTCRECGGTGKRLITITLEEYERLKEQSL